MEGDGASNRVPFDELFREHYGKIASALMQRLGPDRLDTLESAIQEAFLKAIQLWSIKNVPARPLNWLIRTAYNSAIDEIRRERRNEPFTEEIIGLHIEEPEFHFVHELTDDELRLLFLCCHPALSLESQVAFLLKYACGFGVTEIARAFLAKEETIAQRLVRAKQKIRDERIAFELPDGKELSRRLDSVALGIYLLFNEGYGASEGDEPIRTELCDQALELTRKLVHHPVGQSTNIYALTALLLFHRARLKTRTTREGNIILLKDQDRNLWDRSLIQEGARYFSLSMHDGQLSKYHLEAGIAACHVFAPTWEKIDWAQIISYYRLLEQIDPSPVVTLNRIAATLMHEGPLVALNELRKVEDRLAEVRYYMYPAVAAEIHSRLGHKKKAALYYSLALELARTKAERDLLQKRLSLLS